MHERISVVQEPYDLFFAESAPLHVRHSSWFDELPLLSAGTAYGRQVNVDGVIGNWCESLAINSVQGTWL